jgi:hypothetical protein
MNDAEIQKTIENWKDTLLAQKGITGIARGVGSEKVIVYVEKHTPETAAVIPRELDGIPVEVKTTGEKLRILQARTDRWRPIIGGISLGHPEVTAGTYSGVVLDTRTNQPAILSCNHVIALNWAELRLGQAGDNTLQPGPFDGGKDPEDKVGELDRWVDVDPAPAENLVDIALARMTLPEGSLQGAIDIEAASYSAEPRVGMKCVKSGRTTGTTSSTIEAVGAVIDIDGWGSARFVDQIIFRPPLGTGGDSGSLVAEAQTKRAIGVLFAGSSQVTAVNRASNIEQHGIKFIGPPAPEPTIPAAAPIAARAFPYIGPLATAAILAALCL